MAVVFKHSLQHGRIATLLPDLRPQTCHTVIWFWQLLEMFYLGRGTTV